MVVVMGNAILFIILATRLVRNIQKSWANFDKQPENSLHTCTRLYCKYIDETTVWDR